MREAEESRSRCPGAQGALSDREPTRKKGFEVERQPSIRKAQKCLVTSVHTSVHIKVL